MIQFMARLDLVKDWSLYPPRTTLKDAVALEFRLMRMHMVQIGDDGRTISLNEVPKGRTPLAEYRGDGKDWRQLRLLNQLAASFMGYRAGKIDFAAVQRKAIDAANNCTVPALTNIARNDVGGMIVYMASWLVGRELSTRVQSDEDVVALVEGLSAELDD